MGGSINSFVENWQNYDGRFNAVIDYFEAEVAKDSVNPQDSSVFTYEIIKELKRIHQILEAKYTRINDNGTLQSLKQKLDAVMKKYENVAAQKLQLLEQNVTIDIHAAESFLPTTDNMYEILYLNPNFPLRFPKSPPNTEPAWGIHSTLWNDISSIRMRSKAVDDFPALEARRESLEKNAKVGLNDLSVYLFTCEFGDSVRRLIAQTNMSIFMEPLSRANKARREQAIGYLKSCISRNHAVLDRAKANGSLIEDMDNVRDFYQLSETLEQALQTSINSIRGD